jgi:hypothetical protein
MDTIYLTGKEPLIAQIARAAFPSYSGNKFKLRTAETVNVRSSWDGGSRDYFTFVRLSDLQSSPEVPAQSAYDRRIVGAEAVPLPDGIACVQHAIFCGKDMGITIIVNPATLNPAMLPVQTELTTDERIVLAATAGLKSSYGGIKNFRFSEANQDTGITAERWDAAKSACIARKLLNSAGAITVEGRNAIGSVRLSALGKELGHSRY